MLELHRPISNWTTIIFYILHNIMYNLKIEIL